MRRPFLRAAHILAHETACQVCMGAALSACELSRKWRHAISLLRRVTGSQTKVEPQDDVDFLGLQSKDWEPVERALGLREESEDVEEDPELERMWQAFRQLHQIPDIEEKLKEGDWKAADQVLKTLGGNDGIPINTHIYRAAIGACSRANQMGMASEILGEMQGRFPLTPVLITDVVSGCADCSDWSRAIDLLRLPMRPDIVLYNAVMEACCNAGEWERAIQLFEHAAKAHLLPSAITFNTLLSGCAQCNQVRQVEALLLGLRACRLKPDLVTDQILSRNELQSARLQAIRRGTIVPLEKRASERQRIVAGSMSSVGAALRMTRLSSKGNPHKGHQHSNVGAP